jgi:topoisomerase-4 subunit B
VEIRWKCDPSLITDETPAEAVFQFPGGLSDHLKEQLGTRECATAEFFRGKQDFPNGQGYVEWAVAWPLWSEGSASIIATPFPRPMAALTRPGSAWRWPAASARSAISSGRSG